MPLYQHKKKTGKENSSATNDDFVILTDSIGQNVNVKLLLSKALAGWHVSSCSQMARGGSIHRTPVLASRECLKVLCIEQVLRADSGF